MMTSSEFIQKKLNDLVEKFPYIKVKYEYKEISVVHFVEVLPSSTYNEDIQYAEAEYEIVQDFIKHFPYENICFVTEDSYVRVENPSFEKTGTQYFESFSMINNEPISIMIGNKTSNSGLIITDSVSIPANKPIKVAINSAYIDYSLCYSPLAA